MEIWTEQLRSGPLEISVAKTEIVLISTPNRQHRITLHREKPDRVRTFKYLGVTVRTVGKRKVELEATGRFYCAMNRGFISQVELSRKTKTVFETAYMPTPTYGCESRALTEKSLSRIRSTEMRFLRKVAGITERDGVSDSTVRLGLEVHPVSVENSVLGWFGHLNKTSADRLPRKVLETRYERNGPG